MLGEDGGSVFRNVQLVHRQGVRKVSRALVLGENCSHVLCPESQVESSSGVLVVTAHCGKALPYLTSRFRLLIVAVVCLLFARVPVS